MSRLKTLQLYAGDHPTDGVWRSEWYAVTEPMLIHQTALWIGAGRDHRGDLLAALFIQHADGTEEGPLDVLPWDHYEQESLRPQNANFTPFHFEAEAGSRLELRHRGATFGGIVQYLAAAHIKYTTKG
jgi:hypothetical protein